MRALILKLNKKHLEQETYQIKRSAEYAKNKVESKTNKEEVSNSTPLTTGEVDVQELDKRLAEIL